MGITGLLPFLQDASRKCYINEFRGCTVAVDTYCWLHKGAFACADKLIRGEKTNIHIMYCLKYIKLLQSYDIKPIMVFDGQHLPAKMETELKRRKQRKAARARGTELLCLGRPDEALQYYRQSIDISHEMALMLIQECRNQNIDCIVAPYEADAQLAYLNMQGIAHIVITEDSDLVLFGCNKILFKFSLDGSGILVEQNKIHLAMKLRPNEYTFDKFRYMCIMSGCDYLNSLPGIGLKRAHKAIAMTQNPDIYKLLPRLPRYLNLQKLTVPEQYLEDFKLADATFRHQVVFDPVNRELVRLTDPQDSGTEAEYLKNAGQFYDSDRAFQLALGNIDPLTLKVMDNWSPDVMISNTNSIWVRGYKKTEAPDKLKSSFIFSEKTTKSKSVTVSSSIIPAMKQHELLQYDTKLDEELNIYKFTVPQSKRTKVDLKSQTVETIVNSEEPEIKSEDMNPFIKNKSKGLSKFGLTSFESTTCVRSRFFKIKSKEVAPSDFICDITINKKEVNDNEGSSANYGTMSTFTQCSKEQEYKMEISKGHVDVFSFKRKNSSGNLPSADKNTIDNDLLGYVDVKRLENKEVSNSDENDRPGCTSPILSSISISSINNSQRSRPLGTFKFHKLKESLSLNSFKEMQTETSKSKICGEQNARKHCKMNDQESEIENLTPEQIVDDSERSYHIDQLLHINTSTNMQETGKVEMKVVAEENYTKNSTQLKSSVSSKDKVKRSCRPIGLSRNKKASNQPTLFSMFNKMTPKE